MTELVEMLKEIKGPGLIAVALLDAGIDVSEVVKETIDVVSTRCSGGIDENQVVKDILESVKAENIDAPDWSGGQYTPGE